LRAKLYLCMIDRNRYDEFRGRPEFVKYFEVLDNPENFMPEVPIPENPISVNDGIVEIGEPNRESPVLVTGNSLYTHMVLGSILTFTNTDCFLLSVDTEGYTVDMAIYLGIFAEERIKDALREFDVKSRVDHNNLVTPGYSGFGKRIQMVEGWNVFEGPICAAELPIFLATSFPSPL